MVEVLTAKLKIKIMTLQPFDLHHIQKVIPIPLHVYQPHHQPPDNHTIISDHSAK